jgi:hypothetical protein
MRKINKWAYPFRWQLPLLLSGTLLSPVRSSDFRFFVLNADLALLDALVPGIEPYSNLANTQ